MYLNKAFSLIEVLISIIIIGILSAISLDILIKTYKNYVISKELNSLNAKLNNALNILSANLSYRVANSLIGVKCNLENNECIKGIIKSFESLKNGDYQIIEWLQKDVYSFRGLWSKNKIKPAWSGFIDLEKVSGEKGHYKIVTPYSNFNYAQIIDGNYTKQWGVDGYEDVFKNNLEVLIFSGKDGMGEISDINHSYGYYSNLVGNDNKNVIYKISNIKVDENKTTCNIDLIINRDNTLAYESYYLVNSAFALVPKKNSKGYYDLYLFKNYFPWRGEIFVDGNSSLLIDNVKKFKYSLKNNIIKIYICVVSNEYNLSVCKEKVIF